MRVSSFIPGDFRRFFFRSVLRNDGKLYKNRLMNGRDVV